MRVNAHALVVVDDDDDDDGMEPSRPLTTQCGFLAVYQAIECVLVESKRLRVTAGLRAATLKLL